MSSESTHHLRLVASEPELPPTTMAVDEVRATRRSVARFLRALQASGHAFASWPSELVSRLAHADAVTARYLARDDAAAPDAGVLEATRALHAVVRAVVAGLNGHERARLRSFELAIRVDPSELSAPLVHPHRAPEDEAPAANELRPRSLRTGLGDADEATLGAIARRLGLSRRLGTDGDPEARMLLAADVERVLRDDHLLGILVATLSTAALELLAVLVRDRLDERAIEAVLSQPTLALAVGDAAQPTTPCTELEHCGLAFRGDAQGRRLWVPVELCHRLDGVLRAMGS